MDDMWQKLDLKKVGIPQPKNEDTWKILVINRDRNVCSDMGAETTIEVKTLQWEEAWSLFLKNAGQHITSPVIKQHAETVLRKCNGLPLAIIILAKAMANRHMVEVWANAKRELKTSSASLQGMVEDVFIPLKFSYHSLDDVLKSSFLYCALYLEDHSISKSNIVDYCI
ncbi:hypothetical protein AMTRI_Chr02g255270 [Amborella trichopoda]